LHRDASRIAVEVAMKIAMQYWSNCGQSHRRRFVAFENAYHGDTTGAMSLCDPQRSMHSRWSGSLLQQESWPLPRNQQQHHEFALRLHAMRDEIAGVFIEPLVQGAGGMKFHEPDDLAAIARACRTSNVLLIADELATGFGRTGTMFAVQSADVVPDLLCLGKALTGGVMGMAATVARSHVFDAFQSDSFDTALAHGPTFMGNPLACAAASASIELFGGSVAGYENYDPLGRVPQIATQMRSALQAVLTLPGVLDVRVKGAVGVVQVDDLRDPQWLRDRCREHGVWIRPFGDMIYITPSLSISDAVLGQLLDGMIHLVDDWASL
ncbi:MAG: aminotransferase class III-fold pyridoxal phosphate-dependent enzyme, partial [Planctomycetota bacterium]